MLAGWARDQLLPQHLRTSREARYFALTGTYRRSRKRPWAEARLQLLDLQFGAEVGELPLDYRQLYRVLTSRIHGGRRQDQTRPCCPQETPDLPLFQQVLPRRVRG